MELSFIWNWYDSSYNMGFLFMFGLGMNKMWYLFIIFDMFQEINYKFSKHELFMMLEH